MKKHDFSWKNNEIKYPESFVKIVATPISEEKKYPKSFGKIVAIPISEEKENAADDYTKINNRMVLNDEEIGDVIIDAFKERIRTMLSDHRHNPNH